jgi:DNA-directed RNA polymerase II subunit RPB9
VVSYAKYLPSLKLLLTLRSSNLLYPKEERETSELQFVCKACTAVTKTEPACTYRHHLGSTVTETAGVTTDVANDPTVGEISPKVYFCTMCGDTLRCRNCGVSAVEDSGVENSSDDGVDSGSPS